MLPAPGGKWRLNPVAWLAGKTFQDLCLLGQGMDMYRCVAREVKLSGTQTWPLGSAVDVLAYLGHDSEACQVIVSSTNKLEQGREYRYTFAASQLIQVEASERAPKLIETWRYADATPAEYIRSQGGELAEARRYGTGSP